MLSMLSNSNSTLQTLTSIPWSVSSNCASDSAGRGFRDTILQAGDTLVVHSSWKDLYKLKFKKDVVVATDVKHENIRPQKLRPALFFFVASLVLFIITDTLSISQVNALIMGPDGYSVADFMRVGGVMTILYFIVSLLVINFFM